MITEDVTACPECGAEAIQAISMRGDHNRLVVDCSHCGYYYNSDDDDEEEAP